MSPAINFDELHQTKIGTKISKY